MGCFACQLLTALTYCPSRPGSLLIFSPHQCQAHPACPQTFWNCTSEVKARSSSTRPHWAQQEKPFWSSCTSSTSASHLHAWRAQVKQLLLARDLPGPPCKVAVVDSFKGSVSPEPAVQGLFMFMIEAAPNGAVGVDRLLEGCSVWVAGCPVLPFLTSLRHARAGARYRLAATLPNACWLLVSTLLQSHSSTGCAENCVAPATPRHGPGVTAAEDWDKWGQECLPERWACFDCGRGKANASTQNEAHASTMTNCVPASSRPKNTPVN